MGWNRVAYPFMCQRVSGIGVMFRLVWVEIDGTGVDWFIPFASAIY